MSSNCVEPILFALRQFQMIGTTNRSWLIDSDYLLDAAWSLDDSSEMSEVVDPKGQRLQMLVLERRDESRHMARFYVLALEPTLFGDAGLLREWGRIGRSCRRRLDFYPDDSKAFEALETWLARKRRRGYQIKA